MRARNIKPALFKNELLGSSDPLNTILFEGLWCMADREGRLLDRPARIKAEVFPYRPDLDIEVHLEWLVAHKFVDRYKSKQGCIISVIEFTRHQRPHRNESPSELPPKNQRLKPRKTSALGHPKDNQGTSNVRRTRSDSGSLIPDSGFLIPDTGSLDSGSRIPGHPPAASVRSIQGGKTILKNGSGERPVEGGPRSRDEARPAAQIALEAIRAKVQA